MTVLTLASLATTAEPTTWGAGLLAFVALAALASWSAARRPRAGAPLHEFDATTTRIATVTLPVVGAQGTNSAAVKHAQFAAAIAMLAFNERLAQAILAQRDRLPSAYRCRPARARVAASPSLEQVEPPPSMSESRARTL